MRTLLSIAIILMLHSFVFAQYAAEEAIKKVCIAETQAYIDFDFDTWASYHVQSADEQLAWNNPDGTYGAQSGWKEIGDGMKAWFKEAKKENLKASQDNFTYMIHGEMAFVAYDASVQNAEGKTTRSREYRTLLYRNGHWKILAVQAFVDYPSGK
ncbi:MAG: hypothetical protein SFU99_12220 [Saprospiraceae bacterium]|nr:hypothetical protein [Saprospiraceae bacterium]